MIRLAPFDVVILAAVLLLAGFVCGWHSRGWPEGDDQRQAHRDALDALERAGRPFDQDVVPDQYDDFCTGCGGPCTYEGDFDPVPPRAPRR